MEGTLEKFIYDLSWLGPEKHNPTIIIYTLFIDHNKVPEIDTNNLQSEFKKLTSTILFDQTDYLSLNIKVFDIDINIKSDSLEYYKDFIGQLLSTTVERGSLASWCMFEGGFMNIQDLFKEWESTSTYAYCKPGENSEFAIEEGSRQSLEWKAKLKNLSKYIENIKL